MSYEGPISIVCCLFDGRTVQHHSKDVYTPEWANKLYRGFRRHLDREMRFVCLTDMNGDWLPEIERVPFVRPNRDYYSIVEAFRPDLRLGRTLLTGLDTMITGSMEEMCGYEGDYALINNVPIEQLPPVWRFFYPRVRFGNGVVMYNDETAAELWNTYCQKPHEFWNTTTVMPGHVAGSEMVFMCEQAPVEPDALDDLYPGQIASFKRTVGPRGYIKDERIVYFHGHSKPQQNKQHPIVKENWV